MRRDIGLAVATALALFGAIAAVPRPSASASPHEGHVPIALTTEEETALGWLASAPLATEMGGTLAPADSLVRRVHALGERLTGTATAKASPWRFTFDVVDDDSTAVALALPGGTVLVSRHMLAIVGADDDALAAILAHQMAHVLARHAASHMAADPEARALLVSLTEPTLDTQKAADVALTVVRRATPDDDAEPEADALAARLLHEAGMDAAAEIGILHVMPTPGPFHGAPGNIESREARLASLVGQMQ